MTSRLTARTIHIWFVSVSLSQNILWLNCDFTDHPSPKYTLARSTNSPPTKSFVLRSRAQRESRRSVSIKTWRELRGPVRKRSRDRAARQAIGDVPSLTHRSVVHETHSLQAPY